MTPVEEGAAILNHYFKMLAHETGKAWSKDNSRDILRAVCLIASGEKDDEPASNAIPSYHPASAKTVTMRRESTTVEDKEWLRQVAQNGGK